ncbi:hypothetical protein [Priestia endophytica]|uniref:hypothetical protein n=1 Tax=Priestia endophytica TaxID=135735 RepID=UPI00124BF7EE|nr:hypothetical protein [Priestia endophytica]KAB2494161.1 hypothetical protein F8155_11055 [Priestia endophytica]
MKKKTKLLIASLAVPFVLSTSEVSTFAQTFTSEQEVNIAQQEERLKLVGTVISSPANRPKTPDPGGTHSSETIVLKGFPEGTYALKWVAREGVAFDVYRGLTPFMDVPVFHNVTNGVTTDLASSPLFSPALMIANPEGATEDFEVKVYAVY